MHLLAPQGAMCALFRKPSNRFADERFSEDAKVEACDAYFARFALSRVSRLSLSRRCYLVRFGIVLLVIQNARRHPLNFLLCCGFWLLDRLRGDLDDARLRLLLLGHGGLLDGEGDAVTINRIVDLGGKPTEQASRTDPCRSPARMRLE